MRKERILLISAFLLPIGIRSLPELLSWPWPIGFDTTGPYMLKILTSYDSYLSFRKLLEGTNLMYSILSTLYLGFGKNYFLAVKILGPLLFGTLNLLIYLYATKTLRWNPFSSLLAVFFSSTYFTSLRISWDLYRNILGLIFLFGFLIVVRGASSIKDYVLSCVFASLTILSHELTSYILFFIVGCDILLFIWRKRYRKALLLLATLIVPLSLETYQRFSPSLGVVKVPLLQYGSGPSWEFSAKVFGFLAYCYMPLALPTFIGILVERDRHLAFWSASCLFVIIQNVLFPQAALPYWFRCILLLSYPFSFYAAKGLVRVYNSEILARFHKFLPKMLVVSYLLAMSTLSFLFIVKTPYMAFSYFSKYNPCIEQIPSSMLQGIAPIKDMPSLMECISWLNASIPENSVVIEPHAFYFITRALLDPNIAVLHVREVNFRMSPEFVLEEVHSVTAENIYTIWWIPGRGWYGLPYLPEGFESIYSSGEIAVYVYKGSSS